MNIVASVLTTVLWIFLLFLIGRMVLGWVQVFARSWQPRGWVLVIAEITYTVTDPPLKLLGRFIPPVRLGNFALDLSFMVLFFVVYIMIIIIGG
ncbi:MULTISPECIES: YggT family protein [Thermomonospora]|uniref:YggT family protein n=1 Tax=Thermomonospora cellulosilytica TaxID=1411118 RepID=A0A7W3RB93_9ACTN|nr:MULTISPECIES: YggT family protein [Thermomonospora]MBA9006494.1 YggT family protein [Thermomonospora cellulosilytica]